MIFYWIATFWTITTSGFKSSFQIVDSVSRSFLAKPWQSDDLQNLHNSAYFPYMDNARWEFVTRVGFIKTAKRKKCFLIVAGQKMFYRRPIPIFTRFNVSVECIYWDESWFYTKHVFRCQEKIMAVGFVRSMVRKKGRSIPTKEVLSEIGQRNESPSLSIDLKEWIDAENSVKSYISNQEIV